MAALTINEWNGNSYRTFFTISSLGKFFRWANNKTVLVWSRVVAFYDESYREQSETHNTTELCYLNSVVGQLVITLRFLHVVSESFGKIGTWVKFISTKLTSKVESCSWGYFCFFPCLGFIAGADVIRVSTISSCSYSSACSENLGHWDLGLPIIK